jgi:signal peptidase
MRYFLILAIVALVFFILLGVYAVGFSRILNARKESVSMFFQSIRKKDQIRRFVEKTREHEKSSVGLIISIIILGVMFYLALSGKVFWVVVTSDSMYPAFERGDIVLMQSLVTGSVTEGDIIMFKRPDFQYPIVHRVLKVMDRGIYTGGDSSGPDSWVIQNSDVFAKAILIRDHPIVLKKVGFYFILDAREMRDIGPFGQEYAFYKRLVQTFKSYALAIAIIAASMYLYLEARNRRTSL